MNEVLNIPPIQCLTANKGQIYVCEKKREALFDKKNPIFSGTYQNFAIGISVQELEPDFSERKGRNLKVHVLVNALELRQSCGAGACVGCRLGVLMEHY